MIVGCNQNINKIFYSGFTISKVYSCGGELVWDAFKGTMKLKLIDDLDNEYVVDCNGDSSLTRNDGRDYFYDYFANNTITSITVGDCTETVGDFVFDESIVGTPHITNTSDVRELTIADTVKTIGHGAFSNLSNLNILTIGESVQTIGDSAFYNNTNNRYITIPNSVRTIGDNAFEANTYATALTLGNSVETIGEYAFCYCQHIPSVVFPSSLTTIGNNAFVNCASLQAINLPDNITSVGVGAFYNCTIAKTLSIGSGITTIQSDTFRGCARLREITIPNTVRTIGSGAFSGCSSASAITIGNKVTSIGSNAFKGCSSASALTLGEKVTTIGGNAFEACTSLTNVIIPDSVTKIGDEADDSSATNGAFGSCSNLTAVTIGSGCTYIGTHAFQQCNLSEVVIPTNVLGIGNGAFVGNANMTSITVMSPTPPTLGNAGDTFYNTNNCPILVPCEAVEDYKVANRWSSYASRIRPINGTCAAQYRWVELPLSEDYDCNTENYIKYYKEQEQVSTDSGYTWTDTENWRRGNSAETFSEDCGYIAPERWVNKDITEDYDCDTTTHVKYYVEKKQTSPDGGETWVDVVPEETRRGASAETESVDCGYVPPVQYRWVNKDITEDYDCDTTTHVKYYVEKKQESIDGGQTWTDVVPEETQRGASAETESIDCGYITPYKVRVTTTSGDTLTTNCNSSTNLSPVDIPGTNSGITSAEVGNCVTSISNYAFDGYSNLTSVTIPNSVTSIGNGVFRNCSGLTSVAIPDSVATIGNYAFYQCGGLASVIIGSGCTSMDAMAFSKCSQLVSITINATTPPTITNSTFLDTENCLIYVPAESVETYKTAQNWTTYASRIQAIQA